VADRKLQPYGISQNNQQPNKLALKWLRQAKADIDPYYLHLLSLASWGLANGAEGDWPEKNQYALKEGVDGLFGWNPANVMNWLFTNPNGPSKLEQQADLVNLLKTASSPKLAAAYVLNAIYSRQVSENTALQPAASELS
jgi:hypothetical protein